MNRGLRGALLSCYKGLIAVTRVLPSRMRSQVDSRISLIMLSVANTPREELVARYSEVLRVLTPDGDATGLGDYLEFGVCFGYSLECMYAAADRRGISQMRFFGFDSFEGLPDAARTDDGGYWSPRMFASDIRTTRKFLNKARVDWTRVTLVKGWFSDSLSDDLLVRYSLRKASVIMIDCDMYLSARQALDFCGPLIRDEAVIIFDDWYSGGLDEKNMGEKRAFETFLESGDFDAEPLWRYRPNAQVFRVRRRPRPVRMSASSPSAEAG